MRIFIKLRKCRDKESKYLRNFEYKKLRVCLVVVFENCYEKHFLRIVLCVFKNKNCIWKLNSKKQLLLYIKKTCLLELIKKVF